MVLLRHSFHNEYQEYQYGTLHEYSLIAVSANHIMNFSAYSLDDKYFNNFHESHMWKQLKFIKEISLHNLDIKFIPMNAQSHAHTHADH